MTRGHHSAEVLPKINFRRLKCYMNTTALVELLKAWPNLPAKTREAIMTLVRE